MTVPRSAATTRNTFVRWVAATAATALTLTGSVVVAATLAPTAVAAAPPALMVTEIAPDTAGYDDYEYVEITNTTSEDIDLTTTGVTVAYTYVDSDDRTRDVPLTYPAGTVVAAGQSTVLWLQYATTTVDTAARSDDDFRQHYADATGQAPGDYQLVRVTGQAGMANGGDRGIRLVGADGATLSRAHYPAGSVSAGTTAHFRVPADGASSAMDLLEDLAAPSPGVVRPEALVPAAPEPGDPGEEPTPGEPTDPTNPSDPTDPTGPTDPANPTDPTDPTDPPAGPQPDPSLTTAPLQITELLPDSSNVGGADAYEFIEVYNATADPVDFGDYTLQYLYPLEDLTNSNVVAWPATPSDVVVAPGGTLVLWVKNGPNDALTDADFNAKFGTALTMGTDLVEVFAGGMANGSPRGLQITTNTGFDVNRAYYNLDGADDTVADAGIQYRTDVADVARQSLAGTAPASPGSVTSDQVPPGLMVVPADISAPVVTDRTASDIDPAVPFPITVDVTDDRQVRTVTLEVRSDVDTQPRAHNLTVTGDGTYTHVTAAADLIGKSWLEYTVVASDGTNETRTATRRVAVQGVDTSPLRLGVTEGELLSGDAVLSAAGDAYPASIDLSVDGTTVPTTPALEAEPVFAFDAGGVDAFFRNGVLVGRDELHIFWEGIYSGFEPITTPVPLRYVEQGDELVVSVYAGTKAAPEIDPDENNDDFQIKNLRLVLPDGRTLRPAGYTDPATVLNMGDSAGKLDFYDARFTLPDDAFTAVAHTWDTTTVDDGPHAVSATDGTTTVERTVVVDNTAPQITTTVTDGRTYQGEILVDASAIDAGAGVGSIVATLDGATVALPLTTSSLTLDPGEHTLSVEATDTVGNVATQTVTFSTPVEEPGSELLSPTDGAAVAGPSVELRARVEDPSGDQLDVTFDEGYRMTPTDTSVTAWAGTTRVAAGTDRSGRRLLSGDDLASMTGADGVDTSVSSEDAFPYQMFDVEVPPTAGEDALARVSWSGSANADAKVLLYVLDATTGTWEEVDRHVTIGEGATEFSLEALVPVAGHVVDGRVQVLVQHSEGFAGEDLTGDATPSPYAHPEDTPRDAYDFTIGWESDTQYYNESFYDRQLDIHDYLLDRRGDLNLQYLIHTGDVVDNHDQEYQWLNADPAYALLDDAGLPYGVLAGNHDVGGTPSDYGRFSAYFGADRFSANPWYGGDYADNRGHYDLVTAGGMDFLMLYMGWNPGDEEIAWMNEVLAQYPERTAIVNLHEYMLTTGGLGPVPQRIYDEVVATNPNVAMVFSGHYHDAFTRVDGFDDDGDGVDDRQVYQVLFDYQGLPEGGQAFLRLLHFSNDDEQIVARTFSPYLMQYGSDDPTLAPEHQQFTIPYAALGLAPQTKTLATDAFTAEVLTTSRIAQFDGVASGTELTATWADPGAGTHGWYVTTTDPYGAVHRSEVRLLTVTDAAGQPTPPAPGGPGGPGAPGGATDGDGGGNGDGNGTGAAPGTGAGAGAGPQRPTTPTASATGSSRGSLPWTGSEGAATWATLAALLVLAGAAGVGAARRGRRAGEQPAR